jgi:hypothetical protein
VPESIPAVVAYLDLPILNAHGKRVGRLVSWRGQGGASADAEASAVTRANDLVALDCAAGELCAVGTCSERWPNLYDGLAMVFKFGDSRKPSSPKLTRESRLSARFVIRS